MRVRGRRGGVAAAVAVVAVALLPRPAAADLLTTSVDTARTGWRQDEAALSPAAAVSAPSFGVRFTWQVPGGPVSRQVYAQPLVVGNVLIVATEGDDVFGLDATTGAQLWHTTVGTPEPSGGGQAINCGDLTPAVGVTSTPVVDPLTNTVYLVARSWDGSNPASATWRMWALDVSTGASRANTPVTIQGSATNAVNGAIAFDPVPHLQRPALTLLRGTDGVAHILAGFASFCDNPSYRGWVAGVSTADQTVKLWTTEADATITNPEGGIWQSGGGMSVDGVNAADGSHTFLLMTGNGSSVTATSPSSGTVGSSPPTGLGSSFVRVKMADDGTMSAVDFFAPTNAGSLSSTDYDVGAGSPVSLPDGFGGVAGHPRLVVGGGKDGRIFLLDRDSLGGDGQGPSGTDAAVAIQPPVNSPGFGEAIFGHAAVWGGDGGLFYIAHVAQVGGGGSSSDPGYLRAYRINPGPPASIVQAGVAADPEYFGTGSPMVTSDGTTSGSALVWLIQRTQQSSSSAELRAYDALPAGGTLTLRYRAAFTTGSTKFSMASPDGAHVYVADQSGTVRAFAALPSAPTGVTATPAQSSALVSWAPASGSGMPITSYTVTAQPGGASVPVPGSTTSATLGGLTDGVTYTVTVTATTAVGTGPPSAGVNVVPHQATSGYRLVATDGGIFAFGTSPFLGSTGGSPLVAPVVGMTARADGTGYRMVAADGGVFAFGNDPFLGSMGGHRLNQPVVGMAATPDGGGYWLVASDGGVFTFGDAPFLGSMGGHPLNSPIVGMAPTPDGAGYWLVAADGGVFTFGDAAFLGSMGGHPLNRPVVAMLASPGGDGYRLVASDGGVFTFGNAPFLGSTGGQHLNSPVVGAALSVAGAGYLLVAGDGGTFTYGDQPFLGSTGGRPLNAPVVGVATSA